MPDLSSVRPRPPGILGRLGMLLALAHTGCDSAPNPPEPEPAPRPETTPNTAVVLPLVSFQPDAPPSIEAVELTAKPAPEPDCPTLLVQHADLPEERLLLRAPEHVWVLLTQGGERHVPRHHEGMRELTPRPDQGDVYLATTYRAVLPGEGVAPIDVHLELSLAPGQDGALDMDLAVTNRSSQPIHQVEPIFCLGPSPPSEDRSTFSNPRGAVSKVRSRQRWREPDTHWGIWPMMVPASDGTLPPGVGPQAAVADEGLIVKENDAKGWAVGMGWDRSYSLSTPGMRCIHAHPSFLDIEPGATLRRAGRIDLRPEGADALLERHQAWTP